LQNLKGVYLNGNNFISGLPEVVTSLAYLQSLWLRNCKLTTLPPRWVNNSGFCVSSCTLFGNI